MSEICPHAAIGPADVATFDNQALLVPPSESCSWINSLLQSLSPVVSKNIYCHQRANHKAEAQCDLRSYEVLGQRGIKSKRYCRRRAARMEGAGGRQ